MKNSLCLAILSLFALSAHAADEEVRYYDVELIIFENLSQNARQSETWPSSVELGLPESETPIELNRPYPGPIPDKYKPAYTFKRLSKDKYRLQDAFKKLEESPSRRVLLHTAWRQPGMSSDKALNVHLTRSIPEAVADSEQTTNTQASLQGKAGELEAYIKVILSRYLHVDADIALQTRPKTDRFDFFIEESEEPVVYRLNQIRNRIRSTEVHYLDHPVLGMLITMHPVETEKL